MLKKISVFLVIVLFTALTLQTAVTAAILEVDTGSVKADNWQEGGYTPDKMFWQEPISDDTRYAGHVNADAAGDLESGEPVLINGSGSVSVTVTFTDTVNVEKFNLKFINPVRQYFLIPYVSMDGQNWTEAPLSGNASKGTVESTYGAFGLGDGPAVESYITVPAGNDADGDINVLTLTLAAPATAKYFKITFFGNDNATGDLAVGNQWISFNSLTFEGSIYEEPVQAATPVVAAVETPAVVAAPAPAPVAPVTAPQTSDTTVIMFIIAVIFSFAGVVIFKRKAFEK